MGADANRMTGVELGAPLPSGGMAVVWRARLDDGTDVAFKRLRPEFLRDHDLRQMFHDEALLCERLLHPHIVRLLRHGEDDEGPFLAFELVDGADLREILAARGRPLPPNAVHALTRSMLGALSYAHSLCAPDGRPLGVVHRDISPSNVLLSRNGDVKLADFGVAASGIKTHVTRYGELKGKCAYMSPEQTQGAPLTSSSDLFSLGIVLWEAAMCRPLFDRPTDVDTMLAVRAAEVPLLSVERPELPTPLTDLVARLLEREPAERPASAADALAQLDSQLPATDFATAAIQQVVADHLHAATPEPAPVVRRRRTRLAPAAIPVAAPEPEPVVASPRARWAPVAGATAAAVMGLGLYAAWPPAPEPIPAPPPVVVTSTPVRSDPPPVTPEPAPPPAAATPATTVVQKPVQRLPIIPARTAVRPEPAAAPAPAAQGHALLDLNSDPWAQVLVDGEVVAESTPARGVRVRAGARKVTFRNPHFKLEKVVTITVADGERRAVVVDLDQ